MQQTLNDFIKNHNSVEDVLSEQELIDYHELDWPNNVPILHDALKRKIEEDPEYELWVPAVYARFGVYDDEDLKQIICHYQFISNKGRVCNLQGTKKKLKGRFDSKGYKNVYLKLEDLNTRILVRVHRIVASIFIPRPEHLKDIDFSLLQVNHIKGDKTNNDFRYLEWCTSKENVNHAIDNALTTFKTGLLNDKTKSLLGECIIEGKYFGQKILVSGQKDFYKVFGKGAARHAFKVAKGELKTSLGCKWKYATNEDILEHHENIYEPEFINLLKKHHHSLKSPIVGKRISDGHIVLFFGSDDIKAQGFNCPGVYNVCNGKYPSYRGYVFKRIDQNEINKYQKLIKEYV